MTAVASIVQTLSVARWEALMSTSVISKLKLPVESGCSVLVLESLADGAVPTVVLTPGEWAVGASEQCRIVLPENVAESVHAQISVSERECVVCAWSSGVCVNGVEVDDAVLAAGDRLEIGRMSFLLRAARPEDILEHVPTATTCVEQAERLPSADLLLGRISEIADTLDALERSLHGEERTYDRLDQMIERIQNSLAQKAGAKPQQTTESRRDESLRAIREQLDTLAISIEGELKQRADRMSDSAKHKNGQGARLDAVMAQVQPMEEVGDLWASEQTAVTTRMSAQLTRLLDFSQQLCARAAVLDIEATDLSSQWADLKQQQEELSLQRAILDEETIRFRRDIESARTENDARLLSGDDVELADALRRELGDNSEFGLITTGGGGNDAFGNGGEVAASANWHLDDQADDDWSVAPTETPAAVIAAADSSDGSPSEYAGSDVVRGALFGNDMSSAHFDEGRSFAESADANSYSEEADVVAVVEDNLLATEALESDECSPLAVVPQSKSTTDFQSVAPIDGLEVRHTTMSARPEHRAEERAEPIQQIEQLQQLVQEVEHAAELADDFDAEVIVSEGETIDELPVGTLLESVDEGASHADEGISEMRSREAAVAELDALLAAYAAESSEQVTELNSADLVDDSHDVGAANDFEGASESTLELSSGETWYEGQSLEGASAFAANSAAELNGEHEQQEARPFDTTRRATELVAETEQLIDSLCHSEAFDQGHEHSADEHVGESELVENNALNHDSRSSSQQSGDIQMASPTEPTRQFSMDVDDDLDDATEKRGGLFGSGSAVDSDLPVGSLLAQLERKPTENREVEKVTELRSQLADLFGIKTSAERPEPAAEAKPLEERFTSFFSGGKSIEELDEKGALTEEANPIAEEIRNRGSDVEPTVAVAPVEQPKPAEAAPSESADSDDPIRAYMAQLIARNKLAAQGNRTEEKKEEKPEKRTEGTSTIEGYSTLAYEALPEKKVVEQDYSYLSEEPKHKQDKDAVRASMQQLRQLDNVQARTAVVRAGRKQLKLQVLAKLGGTLMSFAFGVTAILLKMPAIYGYVVCGLGMLFACDLFVTVFRNWKLLSKQSKLAREASEGGLPELKADPRTEGRLEQFTKASRQ